MKNLFITMLIISLINTIGANAQESNSASAKITSGYGALGYGISLPLGTFAATNLNDKNSGFAKMGQAFNFSAGIPIAHSNYGVSFKADYANISVDINGWKTSLKNAQPLASFNMTADNYKLLTTMAGLYATFPVNKISFDFRAMAGLSNYTQGKQSTYISATDAATGTWASDNAMQSSATASAMAFDVGFNVRYAITKRFCSMATFDFMHTRVSGSTSLDEIIFVLYGDGTSGYGSKSTLTSFDKPISLVNIGVGLGYQF